MFDLKTPFDWIRDLHAAGERAVRAGNEEMAIEALKQIKVEAAKALDHYDKLQCESSESAGS